MRFYNLILPQIQQFTYNIYVRFHFNYQILGLLMGIPVYKIKVKKDGKENESQQIQIHNDMAMPEGSLDEKV